MKYLSTIILALLLPIFSLAQEDLHKRLMLIEFPVINNAERIKSIDAKTYEGKMSMKDYSQTIGELLDSEKILFNKEGFITFKESERKSLNQKITIKVSSNHTDFTTIQKQGKHSSKTTTELQQETPITSLYAIEDIGVGVIYKTKEMYDNRVVTTTQDEDRMVLSVDTVEYNDHGYPRYQYTDVKSDRRRVEYRHLYNEHGWITNTYIKTINILTNSEGEDVEDETAISQRYQYIHEDKFHNWLTRYTFNQNNKLMNITIRRIDYY